MRNKAKNFLLVTMWLSFIALLCYLISAVPIYTKQFAELNLPLTVFTRIIMSLGFFLRKTSVLLMLFLPLMVLANIGVDFYLKNEKVITRLYAILTALFLIIFLVAYISLNAPLQQFAR
ncbi:MAG: hypothetical protein KAJ18_05990 [Candidatus Omnitrophica bacterium]|nr:hypothetical protein [Candidatus Omnitrophota bacterium]